MKIQRIESPGDALLDDLCALLTDVVDGGASVGFLAPLQGATARRYWGTVFDSLGDGLHLWAATDDAGRVVGSVQLSLCGKENGWHRADVQKLLVLSSCRRQGIASRLLTALEEFARADHRTLLVLDTEAGSHAEPLYQRLAWQRAGEIPDFALGAYGGLTPTVLYYKILSPDAP